MKHTTGQVYYGHDTMRRILAQKLNRVDRWYASKLWPAYVLVGIGLVLIAATIAIIIVGPL